MADRTTTPIMLILVRGKIRDDDGTERSDDIDMGWVTHVPSKGDTIRLDGKLYGVTRVHYNAEPFVSNGPILYAFVHLGLSTEPDAGERWPR